MLNREIGLSFSVAILGVGAIVAVMMDGRNSSEVMEAKEIQRQAEDSPPPCSSLQGEDWRVISLGKNTFLIADVVTPTGFFEPAPSLLERELRAEQAGLRTVLERFEGKVLNVASEQDGLRHIVTVTDERC